VLVGGEQAPVVSIRTRTATTAADGRLACCARPALSWWWPWLDGRPAVVSWPRALAAALALLQQRSTTTTVARPHDNDGDGQREAGGRRRTRA
jgi:hypothetical protein